MTGVLKVDDIKDAGANSIVSSNGSGTLTFGSFTAPNITASTAILPDASDGAAIGSASLEWSDIFLADGAVINLGDDQDVTLTHVADTGIQLNSTMKLMFNDASQYIQGASATVLDIAATDEIELTATLIEVVGNATVSGTLGVTGIATFTDDIIIGDGKTIGSASDVDAITIAANGQLTLTQTLIGTALDISGDIDVDGTTNLDAVDIDGAVNIAAAVTQSGGVFTQDGGAVFNEGSADVDFRVESNSQTDFVLADGGLSAVGINCSPAVRDTNGGGDLAAVYGIQVAGSSGTAKVVIGSSGAVNSYIGMAQVNAGGLNINTARIEGQMDTNTAGSEAGSLEFYTMTGGAIGEVMRMDKDKNVLISKTSTSDTVTGIQTTPNGNLINVYNANGYSVQNRQADDGVFIYFKQANSTEGNISVSGTTVAYNTFTGTHWSRLADNSKPTILRGTVMESLDAMVDWYNLEFDDSNGDPQKIPHLLTDSQSNGDEITYNHNGTDYTATIVKETDIKHVQTKISATDEAKNVYGVFHCWDFGDDDGINDMMIAAVGTYVIRIHKDETVAKGNLLQSNGDGTAKVLAGSTSITADVLSTVFAKVLSNTKIETYADGSFLVPCTFTNC